MQCFMRALTFALTAVLGLTCVGCGPDEPLVSDPADTAAGLVTTTTTQATEPTAPEA